MANAKGYEIGIAQECQNLALEQKLNKLIEKGWRPFGFIVSNARNSVYTNKYFFFENCADGKSLRDLVSKESGLWQFVCENGLIPEDKMKHEWVLDLTFGPYGPEVEAQMHSRTYEYWLMSSALKDESELKQFLIDILA